MTRRRETVLREAILLLEDFAVVKRLLMICREA